MSSFELRAKPMLVKRFTSMKMTVPRTSLLLAFLSAISSASATLYDYDPLEYTGTGLDTQNRPTVWNGAWFTTSGSQPNSLSNDGISLAYPCTFESPLTAPASAGSRILTGGLSANASTSRLLSHTISLAVDGTVAYASALFRKNTANGAANTDNTLIEFVDAAGNRRWGFGIEGAGDKPWLNANGSTTPSSGPAVTPGQTYLIVTKIVSSASGLDTAYLKVYGQGYGTQFPVAEPTTWDATLTETTAAILDRIRVRIDAGNTAVAPGEVDDIRIGTAWQDVVNVLLPITDSNAPTVLSADCLLSNTVNVIFSEPVDPVTAQNTANYSLPGHTVTGVTLLVTTNAQVTLDTPVTGNYTLNVQNVKDVAGNTILSTNVSGSLVPGWESSTSISANNGMAYAMNGKIIMLADGTDVAGTSDQFQYLSRTISGDFDLSVRVESLLRTGNNARAGLMARVDTLANSPNAMIEATPDRFIFQYRTNYGEGTLAVASPRPPTAFPNSWIRLVRSGTVFTGYSSTNNGVLWDQIASFDTTPSAIPVPAGLLVGLVASANNGAAITRAQFTGFGPSVVLVQPALAVVPAGSNIEISWGTNSVGFALQSSPSLSNPTWNTVAGSTTTNRVFVPANNGQVFFRAIYPAP
jgi:hypothetical protein